MSDYSEQNKDFRKLAEERKNVEDAIQEMSKKAYNRENRKKLERLQRERQNQNMDLVDYAKKHKIDYFKARKTLENVVHGGLVHTLRGEIV